MNVSTKSVTVGSSTIGSGTLEACKGVHEIAFVDPSVSDLDILLKGMRRDVAVTLLSAVEPAALQMARTLAGLRDIDVVHVIAHGQAGEVHFSSGALSAETIDDHRDSLSRIGAALSADGEIRLWVCEAAGGERGAAFVDAFARISGVDVAASRTRIGAAEQGGHWSLEVRSSRRELPPLTAEAVAAYTGVLATVTATRETDNQTLTTGNDTVIVNPLTIQATDRFDGGLGIDAIQIGVAGSMDVNLSAAASDGVNGFLSFEELRFVNEGGFTLQTATFAAAQFGEGKISTASTIVATGQRQGVTVKLSPNDSLDLSGLKFSGWTSGTDTFTINGSTGAETIVGTSQKDRISTGGGGADTIAGGGGLDTFALSATDNTLAFGVGTGTDGSVSGYDTIADFAPGKTAATGESLSYAALSIGASSPTSGTSSGTTNDSTLLVSASNETLKSHSITDGIITFDDASTFDSAVALTTAGDVAAAVDYLAANDWGNSGATVAFVATISGVSHTYVYTQQSDSPGIANGSMVDLVNVLATGIVANGTTLSVVDATAPSAPSITTIAENGDGGINATEAADGTAVVVDLSGAGAISNDILTINWGSRAATYRLTAADILAGNATVTVPSATIAAQGDGIFDVIAKLTDAAGNVSVASASVSVTIDTRVAAPTLSLATDGGSSASDGITNDGTVNVDGLEAGASWEYSTDGGSSWTAGVGTSFVVTGDGDKTAIARQTDAVGNPSAESDTLSFTLDTTPAAAPTLALATDSGSSDSDGVTNDGTVDVGNLEAGASWEYSTDGGSSWTAGVGTSFALTGDGAKDVIVRQIDVAGNPSADSDTLSFTLDTMAPTAAVAITAISTDSGTAGDFITNDGTLTVSGTHGVLGAGEKVQLSSDGGASWSDVTTGDATTWSFTDGAIHNSSVTYLARIVDAAGNAGVIGAARTVIIDTAADAPTLALAVDSGSSGSDGITNEATVNVGGLEAGASWEYSADGGSSWMAGVGSSFTLDGDGNKTAIVRQTDVAGNLSAASGTLRFKLDSTARAPTSLSLDPADDSGASDDDGVTRRATGLTIGGLAETGATVSLFDDADNSGAMDNGETVIATTVALAGAFSTDISLAEGSHRLRAFQTDIAGNVSAASGALDLAVDTTAAAPALSLATDSGSSGDGATSDGTVNVGGLEAGASWQYSTDGGGTWTAGTGTSFMLLGDGAHEAIARQTDLAGNQSASSSALSFVLDTMVATPTLSLATDSASADGITNDGTVDVGGLEAGSGWEYSTDGGNTWTAGTGTSFELVGDGTKNAIVRQTDVAGNLSAASSALSFELDTAAVAPASLNLDPADDSGASDGDRVTRNMTGLTLGGLAETGATVSLFDDVDGSGVLDNGETVIATAVAAGGVFSTDISLAEGLHRIRGFQTDVAGNTSAASGALDITVDVTADGGEAATLTIDNPLISSTETAVVTVAGLDGDAAGVITFTDIDGNFVTADVSANGQVLKDLSGLADGKIVTTMAIVDTAGNTATVAAVGNPVLNVAPELVVSLDQYNRFRLTDEMKDAAFTRVTLEAKGTSLAALDPVTGFAEMGPNGVDVLKASTGSVDLSIAQYQALGTVSLTDGDIVTLADTGADLAALLDGGAPADVDALNATDDSMALDWARYQNLGTIALDKDDSVSLSDEGATLSALSKTAIAGLAARLVDGMSSIAGGVSWTIQQFNALGSVILSSDTGLTLNGSADKDTFNFSRQILGAEDRVIGGGGADRLVLSGDYSAGLAFEADTLSSVEQIQLGAGRSYDVTTHDDTVAAGKDLLVRGLALGAGDSLIFDGSAETNGTFTFKGGDGSNVFTGGTGGDSIEAGAGTDTLRYTSAAQSGLGSGYGSGYDTVSGFDGSVDRFALADSVVFDEAGLAGKLNKATFNETIQAALDGLEAGHAAIYTATSGLTGATFLLASDVGGTGDLVVRLNGSANISHLSFTTA
ncbi:MAG: DUF4347 domain-containing protein [Enhydrobacter sp.]|nr:DUF4347 domain-containing protein [Enhydrobacter sp.]